VKIFQLFRELKPETTHNLLILFFTGLFFWTSLTLLLPTLPIYIEDLGGTAQQVGWVMGSFAIGLLLFRGVLGYLADRHSRKIVILIGTTVVGLSPLGYYAIHTILPLAAVRAFHGISVAAFTTGYSAMVVDLSPVKQRGELIGYMSLVVPVGMAIGPALGGFLQESAGNGPLFLLSAGLGGLALLLASRLVGGIPVQASITEDTPEYKIEQADSFVSDRSFGQMLANPALLIPALILLQIGLVFGAIASFLPLFMREIQVPLQAGMFYAAAAIASFATRFFAGRASDQWGRGCFITGSLVCYGLAMLLLSHAHSAQSFILAAILEGTGGGILIPMMIALISDRSRAHERGRVYSICIGGFDLGIAIAGPILGAVSMRWGYRTMFEVSSFLALFALGLFLLRSNKTVAHSLRFALGQDRDYHSLDR